MRSSLVALLGAALVVAVPSAASAKQKAITGKLAKNGYTVIALGYDGSSRAAAVKGGKFSVVPPSGKVTLNLRDAAGHYAGPVVVGKRGKKAIMGVRAGASLGKLKLTHGFATPSHKLAKRFADAKRLAVTTKGRPRGAGKLGYVRGAATGKSGAGMDLDLDGVPNAFDIDDNGNLVLDNNDGSTKRRQTPPDPGGQGPAPSGQGPAPGGGDSGTTGLRMFSNFHFNVSETLNANAGGVTRAQIDDAMTRKGSFVGLVFFLPDGVDEAELDCGGLSYCSAGGTGADANTVNVDNPFPACCDDDGDGLGTIKRGSSGDFQLHTYAPSDKIGSGDTFIESFGDQQLTGSLNYMFNTTPAVKAYDDGSGTATTVSYPAASDALGTIGNPLPLKADANGDYVMKIEFWRPQRDAIAEAGEPAGFFDLGHLNYQIEVPNAPSTPSTPGAGGAPAAGVGLCAGDTVGSSDLTQATNQRAWTDAADDKPADPANTLHMKIDFTKCLAQKQQALTPGSTLTWELQALSTVNDVSAQGWFVCVPAAGRTDCKNQQGPPPNNNPPPGGNPPAR